MKGQVNANIIIINRIFHYFKLEANLNIILLFFLQFL